MMATIQARVVKMLNAGGDSRYFLTAYKFAVCTVVVRYFSGNVSGNLISMSIFSIFLVTVFRCML